MEPKLLREKALQVIRFISSGSFQAVEEPDMPLWPGFYRLQVERGRRIWIPLTLEQWRSLSPDERLEVFVQQMHQIVQTKDAAGLVEMDVGEEASVVGISAAEFRQNLHKALCLVYRELKKRRTIASALGNLANALLLAIFNVEAPLANYSDEATLSIISVYGERYCTKAEEESHDSRTHE